jgi:hypothetical protein
MAFGVMLGDMVRLLRGSIELTAARRSQDSYDRGRRLDDLLLWDDILKNLVRTSASWTEAQSRNNGANTWALGSQCGAYVRACRPPWDDDRVYHVSDQSTVSVAIIAPAPASIIILLISGTRMMSGSVSAHRPGAIRKRSIGGDMRNCPGGQGSGKFQPRPTSVGTAHPLAPAFRGSSLGTRHNICDPVYAP